MPAIAWWPGRIKAGEKNHDIVGGLDLMATFAALGGVKLPEKDRAGEPIVFDSYDMAPILFGTGKPLRNSWFYFTELDLTPGAVRVGNLKFVMDLRGDGGQATGGLAVDTNLGWKGPGKQISITPQIFDLLQDPQERYDIFMNNYTESTWTMPVVGAQIKDLLASYIKYPPRKLQAENIPNISLTQYQLLKGLEGQLKQQGIVFTLPGQ